MWLAVAGFAKLLVSRHEEAVALLRRAIQTNQNYSLAHFWLASALAHLGRLEEARATTQAGLALNPTFTISRLLRVAAGDSDNPTFLAQAQRTHDGCRSSERLRLKPTVRLRRLQRPAKVWY
jgi:tetratricopeptide (TPR) repeat protein